MHMADALISPAVATVAGVAAMSLILVAAREVKRSDRRDNVALMGVLGAFVFAAQMLNFSIPGTGSSGHIIGGVLLSALLGPWAGFLTLCSVLIVQCLVFADGGLLALGCNIINMAATSCLIAYPLVFRPIAGRNATGRRLLWGSVAASVVGLETGALLVSVETVLSGVTALPFGEFLMFMLPIHLAIGLCEGVATGLVLMFVEKRDAALLTGSADTEKSSPRRRNIVIACFAVAAVVAAVAFAWVASDNPDGLEWSIMKLTGATELAEATVPKTAVLPDYESHLSGIVGALIVLASLWGVTAMIFRHPKHLSN